MTGTEDDAADCVLRSEMQDYMDQMMTTMNEAIAKGLNEALDKQNINHALESLDRRVATLTGRMDELETHRPSPRDDVQDFDDVSVYAENGEVDQRATQEAWQR